MHDDLRWLAFRGPNGQIGPEFTSSAAVHGTPVPMSVRLGRIAEERGRLVRTQVKLEAARRIHQQRVDVNAENPSAFDQIGVSWHDDQIAAIGRRMRALDDLERALLEGTGAGAASTVAPPR